MHTNWSEMRFVLVLLDFHIVLNHFQTITAASFKNGKRNWNIRERNKFTADGEVQEKCNICKLIMYQHNYKEKFEHIKNLFSMQRRNRMKHSLDEPHIQCRWVCLNDISFSKCFTKIKFSTCICIKWLCKKGLQASKLISVVTCAQEHLTLFFISRLCLTPRE